MKVYVLLEVNEEDYTTCILDVYTSLSDANAAMDNYNDSVLDNYIATVEEYTTI